MKKFLPIIFITLLILGFVGAIGYFKMASKSDGNSQPVAEKYFDQSANVMYFYSPNCPACQKQKSILGKLADEGYRVKPMNLMEDQAALNEASKLGIRSTPTFYSQKTKDKKVGYQEENTLREWLDKNK